MFQPFNCIGRKALAAFKVDFEQCQAVDKTGEFGEFSDSD